MRRKGHWKVRRKSIYSVIDSYLGFKDWMFFNNEGTQIEILKPTLDALEMMQKYGLCFVVKGFRNLIEFEKFNKIRIEYGMSTMMLASRCLGSSFMSNAFVSCMNQEPMPDDDEIIAEIENNRFLSIRNEKEEKRIKEREYYRRRVEKYSFLFHRMIYNLIKQGRVERLNIIV